MNKCISCNKELLLRHQQKYCSNKCQNDQQFNQYIKDWKQGKKDGNRGIIAKNISRHIKRYLIEKYGERCSKCFWNCRNKKTKIVPLEIDHIDGIAENNQESNLRLLCPNCHSLTFTFRNLNFGNGRFWRKEKYIKNNVKQISSNP